MLPAHGWKVMSMKDRRKYRHRSAALAISTFVTLSSPRIVPVSHSSARSSPVLNKIKHNVIVVQENRSIDEYFGAFPDAHGIPRQNGVPKMCVPDSALSRFETAGRRRTLPC
jgi:phospholipase C